MASVHLIIKGKVQGVFYRASAKEEAEKLGIKGWVKNTRDGNVEAVATGTEGAVEAFIKWCKRGPKEARVDDVAVNQQPDTGFEKFVIKK